MELFRPVDEPVIFDRQHRKIYRIFREHVPGWRGLFRPWSLFAVAYDWDLVDAEHNAEISVSGAGASQQNALTFFVRKSADDPTIIDFFNVGQIMALTEQTVPAVWEHIRRFMEEGGPHLPPGETVYAPQPPTNFWRAMRGVLPMGPEPVGRWMADHPFFTLIFLLLSPVFGPIWLVWGFGNWLSHKTAVSVDWPDEVKQAIGPALRADERAPQAVRLPRAAMTLDQREQEDAVSARHADTHQTVRAPLVAKAPEAIEVVRVEHAGGPLALRLSVPSAQGANYMVVDACQNVFRGELDPSGKTTVHDVAQGWLTVAYFATQVESASGSRRG